MVFIFVPRILFKNQHTLLTSAMSETDVHGNSGLYSQTDLFVLTACMTWGKLLSLSRC